MNRGRRRGRTTEATTIVDLGHRSLKVLDGERGLELALERSDDGALTDASIQRTREELSRFLGTKGRRGLVICAIPAAGVSLRGFDLPPVGKTETDQLVALQIEREFPLPPSQMAWGYRVGEAANGTSSIAEPRRATVAALRRESLDEVRELFRDIRPVEFALGALAGWSLCPSRDGLSVLVDLGRDRSELLLARSESPVGLRSLAWGGDRVTRAIASALSIDASEAERLKLEWARRGGQADSAHLERDGVIEEAVARSLNELERSLAENWQASRARLTARMNGSSGLVGDPGLPQQVFLSGRTGELPGVTRILENVFPGVPIERVDVSEEPGHSAVTEGLRAQLVGEIGPIVLQLADEPERASRKTTERPVGWWVAAALLLVGVLIGPYFGPIFSLDSVTERAEEARAALGSSGEIPSKISFLESIDSNQVPAFEVLEAIRRVSSVELRVDELILSGNGVFELRGKLDREESAHALRTDLSVMNFEGLSLEIEAVDEGKVAFEMRGRVGLLDPHAVDEREKGEPVPDPIVKEEPSPGKDEAKVVPSDKKKPAAPPESVVKKVGDSTANPTSPDVDDETVVETAGSPDTPTSQPAEIDFGSGGLPDGTIVIPSVEIDEATMNALQEQLLRQQSGGDQ